ncbi:Major facilitator superfamily transporter [Acididesulfobacillus acetoxydans]|uniref:Benzoate transport protein n=1 Tax=Acididesulfobacillus acetoxydans TaxID=1561005 RepID=A0A8S0X4N3_9FIRM|nr:MFS transporter [Acididesulfobacillus acetoxydans]CAA7600930.1 Major facilitator superfamily transporter [Acididesulfobacillus acetoxydans]CEJ08913.1 Benzoate transport protein [Acididesulfobacillus acetoxydans]
MTENVAERLATLPLTKKHYKVWWLASLGFFFEGLDLTIVGAILVAITKVFHMTNQEAGTIGSTALAGYVIGVALAGWIGDRYGRKFVMQYTLLVFTVFTILAAFTWNTLSFGVLRFITGIGVGGESAIVTPYLAELFQPRYRGRFMGISDTFYTIGMIIASLIGLVLIPISVNGWRYALVVAGLPALYVMLIRNYLPESPLWLLKKGREEEAEQIVRDFEKYAHAADSSTGTVAKKDQGSPQGTVATSGQKASLGALWTKYAHRTAMLWIIWFFIELVYYGFLVWLPELLVKHGFSVVKSLEYSLLINIAALVGGIVAAFLQDTKLGRKYIIVVFFLLAGISSYLFSRVNTPAGVLMFGGLISFLLNGLFAVLYTFTPEQYPTNVRASGQGFASAVGHVGGVVGPFLVGAVLTAFGFSGIFGLFAFFLIIPIIATIFLKERRGALLES